MAQTETKICVKPSAMGKLLERAKGHARSILPSIGNVVLDRLPIFVSEATALSEEPRNEVPGSAFLEQWVEDLNPSSPTSPESEKIHSDEDDTKDESGMESIPEFEQGQIQSPEDVLRGNSYWVYKVRAKPWLMHIF